MGIDYTFYAERSDKSYKVLLMSRSVRAFTMILNYFKSMVPATYDPLDTAQEYPNYQVTKEGWDSWMRLILSQKKTIDYLAGFVHSAFEFDEFIPDEFESFENLDPKILSQFKLWLFKTFNLKFVDGLTPTEETEAIVTSAYMLLCWFLMDPYVQEYMNMDDCTLWLSIG